MVETDSERTDTEPFHLCPVDMTALNDEGLPTRTETWYLVAPEKQKLFERITPNSSKDHNTYKNFEHYKRSYSSGGSNPGGALITADLVHSNKYLDKGTIDDASVLWNQSNGPVGNPTVGLPSLYVPRVDGGFVPAPDALDDLRQWSLKSMLPTIKGQLSLLNTLFELKDMASVKRSAQLFTTFFRNNVKRFRFAGSRATFRELARLTGDSYLQWKFNISPLISDVQGIYQALANYERRINDFINRSGGIRTSQCVKVLEEYPRQNESDWVNNASEIHIVKTTGHYHVSNQIRTRRTVNTSASIFHATIQYNYNYYGYQREHARLYALLDALGVNFNPAIIWNALPWSFVVDWVIGVSRWLDQFKIGLMEPKINILQYCWSVARRRMTYVEGESTPVVYYAGYDPKPRYPKQYLSYGTVEETAYRRGVGLPAYGSFVTSGLSLTEFSLGAALVSTSGRRHKRNRVR